MFVRRVFWPRPVKDRWPPVVRCSSAATVAPQLVAAGEVVRAAVGCRGRGPLGLWLRFALPGSGTWDAGTSQEGGRSVGWCRALEYGRQVRSLDSCAGASRATLGSRDSASLPTARCGCGRSIRGGLVLSPGVRGQSGRGSSGDLRGLPSCCRGCGGHRPPWGQCFWRVNSFSQPRGVTAPQTQSLPCCPFSPRCRGVGVCSSEAGMSFTPRRTQLLSRDALWWTTSGTGRLCSRSCPRMLAHGRAWPASREARPVLRACGLPGRGLHWVRPDEGLSLAAFLLSPGVLPGPEATGSSSLTPVRSTCALVPVGGLLPAPEEEGAVGLGTVLTHWAGLLRRG